MSEYRIDDAGGCEMLAQICTEADRASEYAEIIRSDGPTIRQGWADNRDELLKFWASGEYTTSEMFPGSLPWLFVCGEPDTLPWAAEQFDLQKDG